MAEGVSEIKDYSEKPLWPRSAYATHILEYTRDYVQDDQDPRDSIQVGKLAMQSWNDMAELDKRAVGLIEEGRRTEYNDDLENHVAYMKFMGFCLHDKQKARQEGWDFNKSWEDLELEVKNLIRSCSELKGEHTRVVLDESENVRQDLADVDDFLSDCPNLRMFFKERKSRLEKMLYVIGREKAVELEREWDQMRFNEMDMLAQRSMLKRDQILFEMNANQALGKDELMGDDTEAFWSMFPYLSKCLEKKVMKYFASIDSQKLRELDEEGKQLQMEEMQVQADMSDLFGKHVQDLLTILKQHRESENSEDSSENIEDAENVEDSEHGELDEIPNLSKSFGGWGFLMKNDDDFMLDFLHWVDKKTKEEWELMWHQLQSREDEVQAKRVVFMDKLKGLTKG